MLDLSTSVQYVKGIGPRLAEVLGAKGIHKVDDLLHYLPFRYEDRVNPRGISELRVGEMATVIAEVRTSGLFRTRRMPIFQMTAGQGRSRLKCIWFNGTYLRDRFKPGQLVALYGKVEQERGGELQLVQPQFEILGDSADDTEAGEQKAATSLEVGRIVPIYESTGQGRLTPRWFRRIIHTVLENLSPPAADPVPTAVRNHLSLISPQDALRQVHWPDPGESLQDLQASRTPAHVRLIFEELFFLELGLELKRREQKAQTGIAFNLDNRLAYYSNPEFLREGSSVRDFRKPPMTLIGAPAGDDALVLRELYAPIEAPVHVAPFRVAESVKFLSNAYHAVKLAFANEAGAVLAEHGVDARAAFALFREDRALNISAAYLRPGFAFGGSCLPKDVRSFLSLAEARHMKAPFLGSVLPSNQALIERAYGMVARHGRQKVALFGLAFKPGTDDLRESPFVLLAERLLGKGFDLCIFDRFVQTARLTGANRAFIEREIPHLERLMADDPRQAAEASRIVVIGHVAAEDRAALLAGLTDQVVIDLADTPAIREHGGIAYEGFCW